MAWARIHVQARKEVYEPTRHGHGPADGGPNVAGLSDERVTQAVFTKDCTQALVVKPSPTFGARGEWSGFMWFFL